MAQSLMYVNDRPIDNGLKKFSDYNNITMSASNF